LFCRRCTPCSSIRAHALATKDVFAGWTPGMPPAPLDQDALAKLSDRKTLLQFLARQENDLERPAVALAPVVAEVLVAMWALPGCAVARMSGSGSTCFALFPSAAEATVGAEILHA
jgi:4-diphosphocytidyl-2-C-methyl-D-erythritol kinase